jgi:hypothetical protein
MFLKLAQIRALGPGRPPQASAESRNGVAFGPASRRVGRTTLVCHWHHVHGNGALECVWEQPAVPARGRSQIPLPDLVGRLIDLHATAGCSPHREAA